MTGNLTFSPDVRAIFGTGMVIRQVSGSHSYFENKLAGSNTYFQTRNASNVLNNGMVIVGGASPYVNLYYANSVKLNTVSDGTKTTGTHEATTSVKSPLYVSPYSRPTL